MKPPNAFPNFPLSGAATSRFTALTAFTYDMVISELTLVSACCVLIASAIEATQS